MYAGCGTRDLMMMHKCVVRTKEKHGVELDNNTRKAHEVYKKITRTLQEIHEDRHPMGGGCVIDRLLSIIIINTVSASPLSSHGQREILPAANLRLKRTDIFMHEETFFQRDFA